MSDSVQGLRTGPSISFAVLLASLNTSDCQLLPPGPVGSEAAESGRSRRPICHVLSQFTMSTKTIPC